MKKVYSPLKVFSFPDKLQSLDPASDLIMPPIHVRIKPTNVCNQHCYFCAYGKNDLSLGQDMVIKDKIPREKMMDLIDELTEIGVQAITFSGGGEPLVYPYIEEVLEKIVKSSKIKLAFITNGTYLEGRKLDLIASYASWIRISVDGWDDKSYAIYRQVPEGKWTQLQSNIKQFIEKKNSCKVGIYMIIDKDNYQHVYTMIKHYFDLGVDSIKVYGVIVSDDLSISDSYHDPYREDVNRQINSAKNDFESDIFQINNGYISQAKSFSKKYTWCPSMQLRPVIGADLFLYSCQDKAYTESGKMGNLKNSRFSDVWFAQKTRFTQINPSIHCDHHCAVNQQNELVTEHYDLYEDHVFFV